MTRLFIIVGSVNLAAGVVLFFVGIAAHAALPAIQGGATICVAITCFARARFG